MKNSQETASTTVIQNNLSRVWSRLTDSQKTWLADEERENHLRALDEAWTRFEREKADSGLHRRTESRLIQDSIGALVSRISDVQTRFAEQAAKETRGRPAQGYAPILALPPEKLALLTLRGIFDSMTNGSMLLVSAYFSVAQAIYQQLRLVEIEISNKDVYRRALAHVKKWTPEQIEHISRKAGIAKWKWDKTAKVYLGSILLKCVLDSTGLFHLTTVWSRRGTVRLLELTPEAAAVVDDADENIDLLNVIPMPMVVPPRLWSERYRDGGYIYGPRSNMVKVYEEHDAIQTDPRVVHSVNYQQSVAWEINPVVYNAAKAVFDQGGGRADMVRMIPYDRPSKPDGRWNDPIVKVWRGNAAQIHRREAKEASKRRVTAWKMRTAGHCRKYPALWFPLSVDFRGRSYPESSLLSPQGDDLARAMLRFAESIPVTEDGRTALKIHLANAHGIDKVSFADRVRWADAFLSPYGTDGRFDPSEDRRWQDAEEPFSALAAQSACLSLDDDGARLPVAVDGTCNGIQHFSAMGRDAIGARATNMTASDKPNDLYAQVAEAVNRFIEEDCSVKPYNPEDIHPCWAWRGRITRKTVKRAVMTTPYGVTKLGMRSQFITDNHCEGVPGKPYQLAAYLESVAYRAIGEVASSARNIMDWLHEVSTICANAGKSVKWTTPLGFVVDQSYVKRRVKKIATVLGDTRIWIPSENRTVSKSAQNRGLPPNFVHSLDACHMHMTALRCMEEDIPFASTHDSFKAHASNIPRLSRILREEFVRMYEDGGVLHRFKEEVQRNAGVRLPDPPSQGTYDVRSVLDAPYFFS